jgi:hypothetical protein
VDCGPPIVRFDFGNGDKLVVSKPEIPCRLWQHKIRYTVIARLPISALERERLQPGDRLTLNSVLIDRRRGAKMTWDRELQCDGSPRHETSGARVRPNDRQFAKSTPADPFGHLAEKTNWRIAPSPDVIEKRQTVNHLQLRP